MARLTAHLFVLLLYMLFGSCISVLMTLHPFSKKVILPVFSFDQVLRRAKGNAIADLTYFVLHVAATIRLSYEYVTKILSSITVTGTVRTDWLTIQ
jgi:hypothetical protein